MKSIDTLVSETRQAIEVLLDSSDIPHGDLMVERHYLLGDGTSGGTYTICIASNSKYLAVKVDDNYSASKVAHSFALGLT